MNKLKVIAISILLFQLQSCSLCKKIAPSPDPVQDKPIPDVLESHVGVNISAPIASVFDLNLLENQIPANQNLSFSVGSGKSVHLYWERDKFSKSISGNSVDLKSEIRYHAEYHQQFMWPAGDQQLGQCGNGGEWPRKVSLALHSNISFGKDWKIHSQTSLNAQPLNDCVMGGGFWSQNVTDRVKGAVDNWTSGFARDLDNNIPNRIDFTQQASDAWTKLSKPINIDSNNKIWLTINPSSITTSGFNTNGQDITTSFTLFCKPRIVTGEQPIVDTSSPLPQLGYGPSNNSFVVQFKTEIGFDELEKILNDRLKTTRYTFLNNKQIEIKNIKVYGSGVKATIQVDLKGDFRGTIYFSGKPVYEPLNGLLSIPDLDYDIKTKNWLVKIANWLLYDNFVESLKSKIQFDCKSKIDDFKEKINATLNKDISNNIHIDGNVDDITPLGIISTQSSFIIVINSSGNLNLFVK